MRSLHQSEYEKKAKLQELGWEVERKIVFSFCLLEFFEEEKRWFLKTCQQLKEFQYPETEDSILSWVKDFELETIVVDFPLSMPACIDCRLECPGSYQCPVEDVVHARKKISEMLNRDQDYHKKNPKRYEQERVKLESEGSFDHDAILSKSFKRKLKKGFVPYWHRTVDLWVWMNYYDELLNKFQVSFDSFGQDSTVQMLRFKYLAKHFPKRLELHESNYFLCLLELLRKKVITNRDLIDLRNTDSAPLARIDIVKKVEKEFHIFLYEKDRELIIKNPKAFQSFILTISGIGLLQESVKEIPDWANNLNKRFFVPSF